MPDLSNLLGAVYGDTPSSTDRDPEDEAHVEREATADERGPAVPDWADDEHLDAAFAQWKPGPSADASPVERAFVKDTDPDDPPPPLADDLAAALSEALVAASGTADDSADTTGSNQPPQRFEIAADEDFAAEEDYAEDEDFAVTDDPAVDRDADDPTEEGEPPQAFAPLHPLEAPVVAPVEPTEPAEHHEPDPAPVDEVAQHVDAVEPEPAPWVMPQRAAAAELTAASRVDSEPFAAMPESAPAPAPVAHPDPAPAPVVSVPTGPLPGDGAEAPTGLPTGARRWDRSEDDILPDKKPAKGFFSFSLRRG
jgi:hypothetical protein